MAHFWFLLRRHLIENGYQNTSPELLEALERAKTTTDVEDVRIVEQILANLAGDEAGAFREERLRCRLYLGALGDSGAALELAMDALGAAYRQEWHMVGDGSLPVWRSLGWLAQAATSRSRQNLAPGAAIASMLPPDDRVVSIAHDLRTRVERCLLELNAVGE
ncbi:hypothetical protein [Aureimonas pseudogalii]|uniref:Uncharacterized protein n=1 Tax=Aureimonas pseudogalii TaxID=1744844 RepID=A0A7W6MLK5_9HYPH|nr:hypothetical protein [Aureimonas pseudogalii]MBB3999865.1 hypothetical protein [Aureimonas pseudogalii]